MWSAPERRFLYELGMQAKRGGELAPYPFPFVRDGVMENEICPILVGFTDDEPRPNKDEIEAVRWVAWPEFLSELKARPGFYSQWCEEEARILDGLPRFHELLGKSH